MRTTSFFAFDRIPDTAKIYVTNRLTEVIGAGLVIGVLAAALSLVTWSAQDPTLNYAHDGAVRNLLGAPGALMGDLIMQIWGMSALALLTPVAIWGWHLMAHHRLDRFVGRITFLFCGSACTAALASLLPVTANWPMPTGLGGVVGDAMITLPRILIDGAHFGSLVSALVFAVGAIIALSAAASPVARKISPDEIESRTSKHRNQVTPESADEVNEPGVALVSLGAITHAVLSLKARLFRYISKPVFFSKARKTDSTISYSRKEPSFPGSVSISQRATVQVTSDHVNEAPLDLRNDKIVIGPTPGKIKIGVRAAREAQPSLLEADTFELPPLALLMEPKRTNAGKLSAESLEQNARLLEGVLDDFGVKGEIVNVRPGPVVTLYELEPAPGIKSSRVIGLADDIARSMSAISARVAVVQGRNAIGIELPNQLRETVFLRELIASQDFEASKYKLAIALGKTIGGEPVIVDLTRMPHLLVAGTTGSGKSVAINTFILSLLYRLKPEECRLIMVDPKMLELSVYDGIPHLLTPVVTDSKKAVVAMKWAVREMEDRYKKMSKLGVRNIDGFNARIVEARSKGQSISRTVQTGFDRQTGEAIYEREDMDMSPLPYIVVIVDEMADLMMVAGKDIEGAIQRLAQMARAAGIHLIMATQRPSVDVITGTIKANFPTRVSFQVTSKIDSRTILGEQGAEQLLGQGDMLYMAGGGRIARVHGPFVSDDEVEKIVAHLKTQGQPDYLDAITIEDEVDSEEVTPAVAAFGDESAELYDKAVAIVLRDGKCSTSYIQRRLSVGYNKAASLVERMEEEGVVGPSNHAGKREILVGGGIDRGAFGLPGD
jgi:S-DNA-T family DNA segregation ATPase FtsK/SpoIIIE